MKKIRAASILVLLAWVFFLIYNTYFGWNMLPINKAEKVCDAIFIQSLFVAFVIYLLPILDAYERWIKNLEK